MRWPRLWFSYGTGSLNRIFGIQICWRYTEILGDNKYIEKLENFGKLYGFLTVYTVNVLLDVLYHMQQN